MSDKLIDYHIESIDPLVFDLQFASGREIISYGDGVDYIKADGGIITPTQDTTCIIVIILGLFVSFIFLILAVFVCF